MVTVKTGLLMAEMNDLSKIKQIRNLLIVIGSAIGLSIIAIFLMLYSYGPAGAYLAKNVLISPESAKALYFNDFSPKMGMQAHFVFDLIQFSYYDGVQKAVKHTEIDVTTYAKLYKLIGNDTSLLDVPSENEMAFDHHAGRLFFKVRADGHSSQKSSVNLFEADFIKDYYRISLRGQSADQQWVYFKHNGILEKAIALLTSQ